VGGLDTRLGSRARLLSKKEPVEKGGREKENGEGGGGDGSSAGNRLGQKHPLRNTRAPAKKKLWLQSTKIVRGAEQGKMFERKPKNSRGIALQEKTRALLFNHSRGGQPKEVLGI